MRSKELLAMIGLLSLWLLVGFAGCSTRPAPVFVYGFEGSEYINLDEGQDFVAPHKGKYLSDEFYKELVNVQGVVESKVLQDLKAKDAVQ